MSDPVKEHFDSLASTYSNNYATRRSGKNYEFNKRLEIVSKLASNISGRLLDCAVGTGEITSAVLNSCMFPSAVVVDISPVMIASANSLLTYRNPSVNIIYENKSIFDFQVSPENGFDLILCLGLVAHCGKLPLLLKHLEGLLNPGGKIILQSSLAEHWGVKTVRTLIKNRQSVQRSYDISYYSIADIRNACSSAQLVVCHMERFLFGFPFGDKICSRANYLLESKLNTFSGRYGSEAIFVIARNHNEPIQSDTRLTSIV